MIAIRTSLIVLCAAISGGQAAPARSTSLSGVVLEAGSRTPITGARAMLNLRTAGSMRTVLTDDAGRFVFEDVKPGEYFLAAGKPSYATAFFRETAPGEPNEPIRVEGRALADLELVLAPGGVITGQVVDPFGQPASGALINLRKVGAQRAPHIYTGPAQGSHETDDRGRYRIFGVAAGEYHLFVTRYMRSGVRLQSTAGREVSYAPVFFPGTADPALAQTVAVAPGEERSGIDFRLQLNVLSDVSGDIDGPPGVLATYVSIRLMSSRPDSATPVGSLFGQRTGNRFIVPKVPPGQYWLTARSNSTGDSLAGAFWAATEIVVRDNDVTGLTLVLQPTSTVSGRVVVAGPEGLRPVASLGRPQVFLARLPGTPSTLDSLGATPDATGSFVIVNVPPGRYRVAVRDQATGTDIATTPREIDVAAGADLKDVLVRVTAVRFRSLAYIR